MTKKDKVWHVTCPKVMGMWESDFIRGIEREGGTTEVRFKKAIVPKYFKGEIEFRTSKGRYFVNTKTKDLIKTPEEARDLLEYMYDEEDWSYEDWT